MTRAHEKPILILHNLRSAHNVGSLFRTADAAGVGKVYLTGYTPTPTDRFGRPQKEIAKTALGAETHIPWEHHASLSSLMKILKKRGYALIALEQDPHALDYRTVRPPRKAALLLGNEVRGISPALRRQADIIAEIPMRGKKESLNVAVAGGIALFALFS